MKNRIDELKGVELCACNWVEVLKEMKGSTNSFDEVLHYVMRKLLQTKSFIASLLCAKLKVVLIAFRIDL